jgi:PmbA protein
MNPNQSWAILNESVHKTLRALEKRGITHAEAFFTTTQTTEVTIRNSEIQTQNRAEDSGVGFRVVVPKNKVGFACANTMDKKAILEAGEKAFNIAKVSTEVSGFALPEARQLPRAKRLFDSHIAEIAVEEVVDIARRMIVAAESFDKRVRAKGGRVIFESGRRKIINTLGIDFEEQGTRCAIYLAGSGEQDGEVTGSCFDFSFSRGANLDPERVGKNVGKMVTGMFRPQRSESFQGTVVFGPEAVSYQVFDALVDALKGENVISGSSVWTKKHGQIVASENLSIYDNAVLEAGFGSRSFDDEGCASQNTILMRKGRLESFLHDATSANSLKTRNTGNASRYVGGLDMVPAIVGNGYRAKPEIYPSNLVINPGDKTKEELVSEVSKGVLVDSMAGFTQAGSGLISAQLSRAFFVQNGEIKYPIKGGMISGVAYDWLKKISGVGKDSKQFQNAIVPSIRVEEVKIIGA